MDTPVDFPNNLDIKLSLFLSALAEVHGWQFEPTSSGKVFKIKANDLAKNVMIPFSSLSKKEADLFRSLGYESIKFNNVLYLRAPQGLYLPPVQQPIPLVFTVTVNTYDQTLLSDAGIDINALATFQSRYLKLFSSYNPATSVLALQNEGLISNIGINYKKLSDSVKGSFTLNLEGNNISETLWREERTRTLLIGNSNVNDARVSVDSQQLTGGRSLSIEPLGSNIYRINFTDKDVQDNNDVTGLTYSADISLDNRSAKLILNSQTHTNKRKLFRKIKQIDNNYYVLTISVAHARKADYSRPVFYSPSLVFPYLKRKKILGLPIGKKNVLNHK